MAGQTTAIFQDADAPTCTDRLEMGLVDKMREASLIALLGGSKKDVAREQGA